MGRKHCGEKEKLLVTSNFSFSQSFQKACFPGMSKGVIVWEWVNNVFQDAGFALALKQLSPSLSPNENLGPTWRQQGPNFEELGPDEYHNARQNFRLVGIVRCCSPFIMYATR